MAARCVFLVVLAMTGLYQLASGDGDTTTDAPPEKYYLNTEIKLFHNLTDKYSKSVRPVTDPKKTLPVQFGLAVIGLEELDERTQTLSLHGWLKMSWTDAQLGWKPEEYDGISQIRIPMDKIWRPDITLYNHFDDDLFKHEASMLPIVYSTGFVFWVPKVRLATKCIMNLYNFPYDQHVCEIKFGSWTHAEKELNLTMMADAKTVLEPGHYQEHLHWRLFDPSVSRNSRTYPCCPDDKYVDITYKLNLARRSAHHIHTIVAPSIVLALLVPVVFILPPESKEKSIFGFGLVVSTILMMQQVQTLIPVAHPIVPRIGTYYITNIVLMGLSLAISAIVTNVWHRSNNKSGMPACLRGLVGMLSRLFCVNRDDYMPVNVDEQGEQGTRRLEVMSGEDPGTFTDDKQRFMRSFARITASSEWRQLAVVLDRLFFFLFLIITILTMVSIVR